MGKAWTHMRIERDVLEVLEVVREHILTGHEQGQRSLDLDDRDRFSLSQLVLLLADDYLRHRERRRRSRRTCAARRREERCQQRQSRHWDVIEAGG